MDKKNYRKGVGMIIVNNDGKFFLGKRIGAEAWQFPQGGIDAGESVEQALYRELHEETGLTKDKVRILSVSKRWLVYHIPHLYRRSKKKYQGAMQKWFLLELIGHDNDINLNALNHAEFDDWKWGNEKTAIDSVIQFKRTLYKSIIDEFAEILNGFKNN